MRPYRKVTAFLVQGPFYTGSEVMVNEESRQKTNFCSRSSCSQSEYDILIIGAGLVGSSLALALAQLPLRIKLLEASVLERGTGHTKPASPISLNFASYQLLQRLGIEKALAAQPILTVHVSEQGRLGKLRFQATEMGLPALGYVVSREILKQALQSQVIQLAKGLKTTQCAAKLDLTAPVDIKSLTQTPEGWQVTWQSTQTQETHIAHTRLLIAADGRQTQTRKLLAIPTRSSPIAETALITWITASHPHHQVAYERFTPNGTVAFLPGLGTTVGVVWASQPEKIAALQQLSPSDFLTTLQQIMGYRLGRLLELSPRSSHPINPFYTENPFLNNFHLMGDAACGLHPIAAQGLNLSLMEIATLQDWMSEHLYTTEFPVAQRLASIDWAAYHTKRYTRQRKMRQLVHTIYRFTQPTARYFSRFRSASLIGIACFPMAKQALGRRFTGLD
jgi:2-octaprenyl-6-methoxyphenol hydroxylase